MSLSHHIDPEQLLSKSKEHPHVKLLEKSSYDSHSLSYSSRYQTADIPKYKIPSKGTDAEATYQLIHDELSLDGNPTLNLASFVHTWMPPQADKLMIENMSKNLIDQDEYPMTQIIHTRCISMLADLWHAKHCKNAVGTATTGSSEAIQLGGLAMKKIWQEKMKAKGKNIHEPGPNIIMGANAQVALEKFARYFDVEARLVPVTEESKFVMDPHKAMEFIDENTIGVFVILGSTYTGQYENVLLMSQLLDEYEKKTSISIPIHVDAASGGFVAPFVNPKLVWDFRIPRVVSINTSGHKFGLTYPGCGWVIFRDHIHLPKDLVFVLHYLGSEEYSFSLNFSRPAAPIIAQYFNLINLGFEGYRNIALNDLKNARLLSRALEASTYFTCLSNVHRPVSLLSQAIEGAKAVITGPDDNVESYEPSLPVVAFRFSDSFKAKYPEIKQVWIQTLLRAKSWIVPNYSAPKDAEHVEILRVVVRENFPEDFVERLICDLMEITESLIKQDSPARALAQLGSHNHRKHKDIHSHHHEAKHQNAFKGNAHKATTFAQTC